MEVRDQAADVPRAVLAAKTARPQHLNVGPILLRPARRIGLVGAVVAALVGHLHALVAEHEGADGWIEGEAVHPFAGRIYQHGRRTVDNISRCNLRIAGTKDGGLKLALGKTAQHAEDGSHVDVHVDVGGAVERIEDDDVLAGLAVEASGTVEGNGFLVLLAHQRGD